MLFPKSAYSAALCVGHFQHALHSTTITCNPFYVISTTACSSETRAWACNRPCWSRRQPVARRKELAQNSTIPHSKASKKLNVAGHNSHERHVLEFKGKRGIVSPVYARRICKRYLELLKYHEIHLYRAWIGYFFFNIFVSQCDHCWKRQLQN
jgi:hypothetical protein